VPAAAILNLHDREWVYTRIGNGIFRRVEIIGGRMLPNNMQEVISGIKPGSEVIANALQFSSSIEQQ
jgi:cobalt-zinc-cadmium efflux system membrane fusion protein